LVGIGFDGDMDEIDIWRSAEVLRKQYGEDAAVMAAMRADQLLDEGDMESFGVMKRVVQAINELDRVKPSGSESLN
jgi:hypothetical protein